MIKTMMVAAFSAVSIMAFAQSPYGGQMYNDDQSYVTNGDRPHFEMRKAVCKQDEELQGGDRYDFESMLNHMPSNEEAALVKGLFHARRQSVIIYNQMCAAAIPPDAIPANNTFAVVNDDEGNRPMRMIMQSPKPHDIDYNTALDILTEKLNATQTTQLDAWWQNTASEREKDICVRLLMKDAMRADDPIYVSLLVHRTYVLPMATPQQ